MAQRLLVVVDGETADPEGRLWDPLRALGEVRVHSRTEPRQLLERCANAELILTNKVPFDAKTLAALPALRYLGVTATGVNPVDLDACAQLGVAVTNVPNYSTASVAQLVLAMVLHFTQGVAAQNARVKAGEWARSPDFCLVTQPMVELAGKTAVIVGLGAIGTAVGAVFRALGMEILAAQVPGTPARPDRAPLREALAKARVVSLHCPLTEQTRGLVNADFLRAMRKDAILVNTSRGGLIDEVAVAQALHGGALGGFATDVLQKEPPPADHALLDPRAPFASRVLVTPHVAWATNEAKERLVNESIANVQAWARGERRNRVESK